MPITTKTELCSGPLSGEVGKVSPAPSAPGNLPASARVISQKRCGPCADAPAQVKDFISRMFPPDLDTPTG